MNDNYYYLCSNCLWKTNHVHQKKYSTFFSLATEIFQIDSHSTMKNAVCKMDSASMKKK